VSDAGAAWAAELEKYRDSWPAEFVPFDEYVRDVLGQLPIDPVDAAEELAAVADAKHVVIPGGFAFHRDRAR